ncbi:MAG: FAD-dependent oxidoreductase [Desulfomonile tiedjei]|uniref:FAD-dependent oxidoreductase n=1 Tax=Desulfomonile tiedjei TaxID=2358 RepID=A0A9D6Z4V8_9BACT|nr:FAD-dependent oxidoreductase [Desulfomonile tiedjei]
MKDIRFGRWGSVLRDRRQGDETNGLQDELLPPPKGFPANIVALMSGKGFLLFGDEFNFVPMIREYVGQIQAKYCCGKCITGIKGSKMLLLTLDRMMRGEGSESDLDVLSRMAEILNDAAKCSVCQSAGELLKDGLAYFREDFLNAVRSGVPEDSVRYLGSISAPCMNTCPCHINIPGYVEMLQELRYEESLEIIREEMPLPGITGRICPAPCEKACSVANMGDVAIPIKTLKRVAADYEMFHHIEPPLQQVELTGEPVAVVGAGPAGLAAAYYLNRLGHPVTVFEALPISGGMVGVGIPPYRQPREVLQREIAIIQSLGVKLQFEARLGKDFTIQGLFDKGFKSVFLGIGSHKSSAMGLKEENQGIQGVFSGGIDFLRDINLGNEVEVGENVIIAGGGNTAIDCARTCLRMGASRVTIVYRRTDQGMPADPEEVEDSREEGINFLFLTQPVSILSEDGRMTGLRCVRMELGDPDPSGRRRPVPVEGSQFDLAGDTLIPAIGQIADLDWLSPDDRIQFTRKGAIKVDPASMMTSRPGVFAAGDAVSGPLTVVHGLAGGKRAAHMIHQYVTTGSCSVTEQQWMNDLIASIEKDFGVLVTARSPNREGGKVVRKKQDANERITNFLEVDSGFTQRGSFIEASRCLRCFHVILAAVK